jgi:hypothetical protein
MVNSTFCWILLWLSALYFIFWMNSLLYFHIWDPPSDFWSKQSLISDVVNIFHYCVLCGGSLGGGLDFLGTNFFPFTDQKGYRHQKAMSIMCAFSWIRFWMKKYMKLMYMQCVSTQMNFVRKRTSIKLRLHILLSVKHMLSFTYDWFSFVLQCMKSM